MNKKYVKVSLVFIIVLATIFASGCTDPSTSLSLDETKVTIGENQTEYTIKGSTEADTVNISSKELKLENIIVNVSNGKFKYDVAIPRDIDKAEVKVVAKVEDKVERSRALTLTRGSSEKEEPKEEPKVPSESEYKSSCEKISYGQLEKNPRSFTGKKLTYTGEVLEIMEENNFAIIRLAVDGNSRNVIFVTFDENTPIVRGDTITIWGESLGEYTYTSQANYKITIPWVKARYIQ